MPVSLPLLSVAGTPTNGVSEVQSLTPAGAIAAGTWTITFDGDETAALDFDATFAEIQTALEALGNIGVGNIVVSGDDPDTPTEFKDGGVVTLTFAGDLAGLDVAEVTVDDSLLVDGLAAPVGVTVATETAGVRGTYRGAQPGALLQDTTGGVLYQQMGTEANVPQWTDFSSLGT